MIVKSLLNLYVRYQDLLNPPSLLHQLFEPPLRLSCVARQLDRYGCLRLKKSIKCLDENCQKEKKLRLSHQWIFMPNYR